MVFADAAARTTALTGVVSEGMLSYLKDTNAVEVYNGSAWVASDDPNAIQNTIVDAKGDLITATAADTPARLAAGNNGETLVADSATTTGLRWSPAPSTGNPVINSAFQVWQRGTSVSVSASTATYTADRWLFVPGASAASTVSRQATGDSTNLPNIQYCARIQRNSGQTGANQQSLYNMFESINSIPFAGKTVTVSFYARKGADFSPTSSNVVMALYTGTGTDQNLATAGYTGQANPGSVTASLTSTWTRYSFTATIATTATELSLFAYWTTVGTASTNDYWELTGVQIDLGSVALPFRTQNSTLQGELAACQRYYYRASGGDVYGTYAFGWATSTTASNIKFIMPVTMRAVPTSIDYASINMADGVNAQITPSSLTLSANEQARNIAVINAAGTGYTQYRNYSLIAANSGTAYIGVSAEL